MTKNVNNNDKLNFIIHHDFQLKFVHFDENKRCFFDRVQKISIRTFVIDNFNNFCLLRECKHFQIVIQSNVDILTIE